MGLILISCSKDDSPSTNNTTAEPLATAPVAKAENDASSTGVYKGVFVGSTGYISIFIKNGNDEVKAIITVDGKTLTFTSTETVKANEAINGITFTSGSNSFKFYASADGSTCSVSDIIVAGHPKAAIDIIKEKSTVLVKCYEGTFTGDVKGTFNLAIAQGRLRGIAKPEGDNSPNGFYGQVDDSGNINAYDDNVSITGKINGDAVSGNWNDPKNNRKGTWTGKRTY